MLSTDSKYSHFAEVKNKNTYRIMKNETVLSVGISTDGIVLTVKNIDKRIPDKIEGVPIIQKVSKTIVSHT